MKGNTQMKKRVISNTMTAKEYSEWYSRTKVPFRQYPHVVCIHNLSLTDTASNQKVARKVGQDTTGVGRICKELEKNGIIYNVSEHDGRRDWKLTDLGKELYDVIYEKMGLTNGTTN